MDQWYEKHPEIQDFEKRAMQNVCPSAKYCYLPSGDAGWIVHIRPHIKGECKEWTLLIKYPFDYPSVENSFRFYLIKPNYYDLQKSVSLSNITPKTIPYIIFDTDNNMYYLPLCKEDDKRCIIRHATVAFRIVCRWITVFELGLTDQAIWTLLQDEPKW